MTRIIPHQQTIKPTADDSSEIDLLRCFSAFVDRVRETKLLQRGMTAITNIEWKAGEGIFAKERLDDYKTEMEIRIYLANLLTNTAGGVSILQCSKLIERPLFGPGHFRFVSIV